MPSCVFRKCTNYLGNKQLKQGISYHRFPTNEVCLQEWIAILRYQRREPDWMPSKGSRVCSDHFKKEDKYTSKKGLLLLKKEAIPVIVDTYHHKGNISPTSLDDVELSEEEEIFETPMRAALKNQIKQLTMEKKVLQSKNKSLTAQNIRLKRKCVYLKDRLKILKQNTIPDNEIIDVNLNPEIIFIKTEKED